MTIYSRETVRAAFERAKAFHPNDELAAQVAAQALCIPLESVLDVLGPVPAFAAPDLRTRQSEEPLHPRPAGAGARTEGRAQ